MNIEHIKNIASFKRSAEVAAAMLEEYDSLSGRCFKALGGPVQRSKSADSHMINVLEQRDLLRSNLITRYEEYIQAAQWGIEELESIADTKLRKALYMRFVREESWPKIAEEIGGKASSDSVKKSVERFLDQNRTKDFAQ